MSTLVPTVQSDAQLLPQGTTVNKNKAPLTSGLSILGLQNLG
jgi:hypothetical protein